MFILHELTHPRILTTTMPHILLVEDNLINLKILRRQLESKGFKVSVAANGQVAVNTFKNSCGENNEKPFDVVLMDQEMVCVSAMPAGNC